jgi:hypothetical protein
MARKARCWFCCYFCKRAPLVFYNLTRSPKHVCIFRFLHLKAYFVSVKNKLRFQLFTELPLILF